MRGVVGREPLRDLVRGAGHDQLALAGAQLARGGDEGGERLLGHGDRAGQVDDEPAHAAGERGVDAAVSSPTVASSSVPRTSS